MTIAHVIREFLVSYCTVLGAWFLFSLAADTYNRGKANREANANTQESQDTGVHQ